MRAMGTRRGCGVCGGHAESITDECKLTDLTVAPLSVPTTPRRHTVAPCGHVQPPGWHDNCTAACLSIN